MLTHVPDRAVRYRRIRPGGPTPPRAEPRQVSAWAGELFLLELEDGGFELAKARSLELDADLGYLAPTVGRVRVRA